MKRKYLSILLTVCMVFTTMSSAVFASDSDEIDTADSFNITEIDEPSAAMDRMAVPQTAEAYAANAKSGTDYVIADDTTLIIKTAEGAAYWSARGESYHDYNVKLDADIDASGFQWVPIGAADRGGDLIPFTGTFDGQGHKISGMNFANNSQFSGLFGAAVGAVINNITVSGSIGVTSISEYWVEENPGFAAGIVCLVSDSTITNCHSEMQVTVDTDESSPGSTTGFMAGGIAAFAGDNVRIDSCSNSGEMTVRGSGMIFLGGIAGDMELLTGSASIRNCANTGALTVDRPDGDESFSSMAILGGIVGKQSGEDGDEQINGLVENCYNTGTLSANSFGIACAGGIAGLNRFETISNCYNVGTVRSTANLASLSAGIFSDSTNSGGSVYSSYWKVGTADTCVNADGSVFNCGTFETDGMLAPTTVENAGTGGAVHDLLYGSNLLDALNGWVEAQAAPDDYNRWIVEPGINNGYPIFRTGEKPETVRKAALDLSTQTTDEDRLSSEGWAWYFEANETLKYSGKTLVLSGLTLETTEAIALKVPSGTTIVLAADTTNTITGGNASSDSGSASAYGVYGLGTLTILGDGTLNVTSGKATCIMEKRNGYSGTSAGISSAGDLTVAGGVTVNSTGGEATSLYENGHSTGINSDAVMTIQSGNVTGIGGKTSYERGGANAVSNGIFASSVQINGGTVTAYGGSDAGESCGISSIFLEITGGTVVAYGGSSNVEISEGICSIYSIKITGGVINATGRIVTGYSDFGISLGMYSLFGTEISGGIVTATGGSANTYSYGIFNPTSVSISGGIVEGISGDAGSASYGISSTGNNQGGAITLTITGGRVTAKNGEAPDKAAIIAYNSASESDSSFNLTIGSAAKPASIENATDGANVITVGRGTVARGKLLMSGSDAVVVSWKTSSGSGGRGSNTSPVAQNPEEVVSNVPVVSEANMFSDIDAHWAKEDILFVVSRGLFTGTGNDKFSPDLPLTRGMLVTALGRLAQADVGNYKESSFVDVPANAYYTGYVEWAHQSGIVNGMGGGKYAPNAVITRQQMAVMIDRYAAMTGFRLPASHEENMFADGDKIRSWAKDAVERAQMAGILNGKTGNLVDPDGNATRAEVSSVLRRYIELLIANDKANQ